MEPRITWMLGNNDRKQDVHTQSFAEPTDNVCKGTPTLLLKHPKIV